MDVFLISTAVVAVAEIGDKTQLLALMLVARFGKPAPIIAGIAARLLSDRPDLSPQQLESWITATPSRVYDANASMAQGRVAYVRSIAPAATVNARATLQP